MDRAKGAHCYWLRGTPFKRILGVEFSKELHDVAVKNVATFRRTAGVGTNVECVWSDAAKFRLPDTRGAIHVQSFRRSRDARGHRQPMSFLARASADNRRIVPESDLWPPIRADTAILAGVTNTTLLDLYDAVARSACSCGIVSTDCSRGGAEGTDTRGRCREGSPSRRPRKGAGHNCCQGWTTDGHGGFVDSTTLPDRSKWDAPCHR